MTPENYFIQRFGKTAEDMIKDGELISPTHVVTLMKEFINGESSQVMPEKSPDKVLESILKEVSSVTEISFATLKTKTRKREVVEARQFYFKRAKMFTKRSLASIGALVGKDHATVLHGIKTVNNIIEVKEKYEELFEGKKRVLKNKMVIPSEISVETKGLLIGKGTEVVRMTSPFTSIQSEVVRPYSGYRVHSM